LAGGIDWFRWHHGSVTDPKFQLVAKKAGARLGDVVTVWAFILEKASADTDRGHIGRLDFEAIDFMLGAEDGTTIRILDAMTARGLLDGSRISSWEERQPKREREGDSSTDRVRAFRDRKRHETPGNATERQGEPSNASPSQETPREEERRVDKKKEKDSPAALTLDDLFNEGVTREAASEWIAVRKRKKAGPVTPLAWSGFKAQASKAGWGVDAAVRKCVERNWISFEADWVQSGTGETLREKRARERVHEMTGGLVSARPPGQPQQPGVFDVPLAIGMD
jgi:hypothetical protein